MNSDSDLSWHCNAELWGDYRRSELLPLERSSRAGIYLLIGSASVGSFLLALIFTFSYFGYFLGRHNMFPIVIVSVITFTLMLSGAIMWLTRRGRDSVIATPTGEVTFGYDGITLNGDPHDWVFSGKGWRLRTCVRRSVAGILGPSFEIVDFHCTSLLFTGRSYMPVDTNWRIPVPVDKIFAVDALVERISSRIVESESLA